MPPSPEVSWVIRPDVVTTAITALVWVVGGALAFLATSLMSTLLYIWSQHKKEMAKISTDIKAEVKLITSDLKDEVGRVAKTLENISTTLFDRQRSIEIRMGEQETRCDERHTQRRRNSDPEAT